MKRKYQLKKMLYEEKEHLECPFYLCDRIVENIEDLLNEKTIYLQDAPGEPTYDQREIKKWIETPQFNVESLMQKEWLSYSLLSQSVKGFDP